MRSSRGPWSRLLAKGLYEGFMESLLAGLPGFMPGILTTTLRGSRTNTMRTPAF